MSATHVFAGIPVRDHAAALAWYEQLLGRPPDRVPRPGDAVWDLSGTGSLYVVEDAERAGAGLVTLAVADLAPWLERGDAERVAADSGPPRLAFVDADGNRLTVFEDPAAG